MIAYLDSSSIVSVYLEEEQRSQVVEQIRQGPDALCCSAITYVEVRATLARARREGRLAQTQYEEALGDFTSEWPNYVRVPISDGLINAAAQVAEQHSLKSLDAIQLASAITIRDLIPDVIAFSSWDSSLRRAAISMGFELAHAMP